MTSDFEHYNSQPQLHITMDFSSFLSILLIRDLTYNQSKY